MSEKNTVKLFCCFCGGQLVAPGTPAGHPRARHSAAASMAAAPKQWVCQGCRARFQVAYDSEGCVTRLEVTECGTPQCCRVQH